MFSYHLPLRRSMRPPSRVLLICKLKLHAESNVLGQLSHWWCIVTEFLWFPSHSWQRNRRWCCYINKEVDIPVRGAKCVDWSRKPGISRDSDQAGHDPWAGVENKEKNWALSQRSWWWHQINIFKVTLMLRAWAKGLLRCFVKGFLACYLLCTLSRHLLHVELM